MPRTLLFVLLALFAALPLAACEDPGPTAGGPTTGGLPPGDTATVVDIIDGDTIDVRLNGVEYRVRYIGVNTPERADACYREATDYNANLVEGREVLLVRDISETDRFDRLLRYVYVDGVFVNAALVNAGYAEARDYPPDTANADYLDSLESAARTADLGCWPTGVFDD